MDSPVAAAEPGPDLDATRSGPAADAPIRRPPFRLFLWYCYQGSLPAENHSWVLHDVTCRTWALRHFGRWTMVIGPLFIAYVVFLPAPFGLRLYTGIAFALALYLMALVFILIDTDRRAVRAGFDHSRPQHIRSAKSVERQGTANHARRERIAARQHARAHRP